jgi:FtsZ-interacting cell division protein ZipA
MKLWVWILIVVIIIIVLILVIRSLRKKSKVSEEGFKNLPPGKMSEEQRNEVQKPDSQEAADESKQSSD